MTPADSAKIFEFCVATVLLNGLRQENTGTGAPRRPYKKTVVGRQFSCLAGFLLRVHLDLEHGYRSWWF
jgi:hypothetical protein